MYYQDEEKTRKKGRGLGREDGGGCEGGGQDDGVMMPKCWNPASSMHIPM